LLAVAGMAEWTLRVVASQRCPSGLEGWMGRELELRQRLVSFALGPW
jgi:hypothetical protein